MSNINYEQFQSLPKLIAFDLDGTIWSPDMYQLWGGGAPFRSAPNHRDLLDCQNQKVSLLGIVDQLLHDVVTIPRLQEIKIAWVSCTDEPQWAEECLRRFQTTGKLSFHQIVHSKQIYKANKQVHFQQLQKEFPEIAYSEMLFFDNESHNIRTVSQLGVKCYHCADGMTQQAWEEGLSMM